MNIREALTFIIRNQEPLNWEEKKYISSVLRGDIPLVYGDENIIKILRKTCDVDIAIDVLRKDGGRELLDSEIQNIGDEIDDLNREIRDLEKKEDRLRKVKLKLS